MKEFLAGVLFAAVGILVGLMAFTYPVGTAARLGPGFFPAILGWTLAAFGLVLIVRNARGWKFEMELQSLRAPALVTVGVLTFAALIRPGGLASATLGAVGFSCLASRESRLGETLLIYVGLTAFVYLVFVVGLGQPLPLLPAVLR
jgi:hypothetical protein